MNSDEMEIDREQSKKKKIEALQAFVEGSLASAVTKLNGSARGIPSSKDYHFYNNFQEFKGPMKEIAEKSKMMLREIGSSKNPWGKSVPFPDDSDDSYDWLVDRNDDAFEKIDASVEEFQRLRAKEEEENVRLLKTTVDSEDGFQLVSSRKNKKGGGDGVVADKDDGQNSTGISTVKMAFKDKKTTGARPQIPFHIPTIPRPQDAFRIVVNNSNNPFEHVWLQKSEDGSKFIHPLEKLSEMDFVDRTIGEVEPVKPLPLENTPFKLVEDVKELKGLAAKLRDVNEFAVDLEHNNYRSFQGMTCLMQISTRTEDFVVDTLKLRVHIGPYLREVFKDPSKRKVMHGADHDIRWLQRDFGIYVCNLFDTGQASRLLQLERNSLEYLLYHFCEVTANKEYQNADWRIRPIPDQMLRYARDDTHYLLHIYDLMKSRLLSATDIGEDLLLEVYKRSCAICMQLYKKELLTDISYLHIYGLQGSDFNSQQLAIVSGLCEWRDAIARSEDESTGYILPNRTLLEIARQMPITAAKLRRLLKSKHPYVDHNIGSVVAIIRNSIQHADAFESAAEQLKERAETALKQSMDVVTDEFEALAVPEEHTEIQAVTQPGRVSGEDCNSVNGAQHEAASLDVKEEHLELRSRIGEQDACVQARPFELSSKFRDGRKVQDINSSELFKPKDVPEATVQVLKKPNRAFGAMLGNMGSKRKLDPNSKDKAESKVEQIKSTVTLPFHSFLGSKEQLKPLQEESIKHVEIPLSRDSEVTKLEEIIPLESGTNNHESSDEDPSTANGSLEQRVNGSSKGVESVTVDDEMSELHTGFENLHSLNEMKNKRQVKRSQESDDFLQFKPYDYATAREQVTFGEVRKETTNTEGEEGSKNRKDSKERQKKPVSSTRCPTTDGVAQEFQQPRRRQAFPQSGNRSTTFR